MSDRQTITNELNELNSRLPGALHPSPFSVPPGYFEELAPQILSRIRKQEVREELEMLSTTLGNTPRKNPYATPAGYFDQAPTPIVAKQTPVVSLFRQTWVRYAAAAVVFAVGVILWSREEQTPPVTANKVINELQKDIQQLSDNQQVQLQEFLEAGMTGSETAQLEKTIPQTDGLLADVSELELNEFIEQSELITPHETND